MEITAHGKFLSFDWMDRAEVGILLEALECHAYGLEKRISDAPVDDGGATASIVRQELETVDLWIETIQNVLGM